MDSIVFSGLEFKNTSGNFTPQYWEVYKGKIMVGDVYTRNGVTTVTVYKDDVAVKYMNKQWTNSIKCELGQLQIELLFPGFAEFILEVI